MATAAKFEVEKGVPFSTRRPTHSRYPFADMEVGDSFFVPNAVSQQLSNYCSYQRLKYGTRFSCRKAEGGVRVWRTA